MLNRSRLVIAICAIVVVVAVAARSATLTSADSAPIQAAVPISVKTTVEGADWSPQAIGLSLETFELTNPNLASGDLKAYLRTLGPGTLHFGGASTDQAFFTPGKELVPEWSTNIITPADYDRLAALAKESGWSISIAVNFQHFDPERAAAQARTAQRILGSSLASIGIGYKPDAYYDDFGKFISDYQSYVSAIEEAVPGVAIEGSDFLHNNFASQFLSHPAVRKDVSSAVTSFYPLSMCTDRNNVVPTVHKMLSPESRSEQENAMKRIATAAKGASLPPHINETNSVSCGGAPGVSNVYGSAIWAFDYALMAQRTGIEQVAFDATLAKCDDVSDGFEYYTPLCSKSSINQGFLTAQPQYMGLLAARQIPTGTFVSVDNPGWKHVRAFAIKHDKALSVVIVNIDDPKHMGALPVELQLDDVFRNATALTLETNSSAGFSARDGIKLGAQNLDSRGKLRTPQTKPVSITGNKLTYTTVPGSITILSLT